MKTHHSCRPSEKREGEGERGGEGKGERGRERGEGREGKGGWKSGIQDIEAHQSAFVILPVFFASRLQKSTQSLCRFTKIYFLSKDSHLNTKQNKINKYEM